MPSVKPGDRISEYVLEAQVGAGSFGQVWRAHHHIWEKELVAVKIPTDSQFVRNLRKEGSTVHGLRHPNIVRAIGLDPYAEIPYFIMEYVSGCSLRQLIERHAKGLPLRSTQQIIRGVLRALEHAHENGVIHCDIKPENILVARGGATPLEDTSIDDVKVTDFGLGQAGQITTNSIMQSGSLLSEEGRSISGTLAYMAPEQRDGKQTDARSDLYSVGIVLFEIICGERPSGGDMPSHIRVGLPPWVDQVFSKLYTRQDRRLASAAQALRIIDAAAAPPVIRQAESVMPPYPQHPPPLPSERQAHSSGCPRCGAAVAPDDNFCTMCGAQTVDRIRRCPGCGGYPTPDDRFCIFCGQVLQVALG